MERKNEKNFIGYETVADQMERFNSEICRIGREMLEELSTRPKPFRKSATKQLTDEGYIDVHVYATRGRHTLTLSEEGDRVELSRRQAWVLWRHLTREFENDGY